MAYRILARILPRLALIAAPVLLLAACGGAAPEPLAPGVADATAGAASKAAVATASESAASASTATVKLLPPAGTSAEAAFGSAVAVQKDGFAVVGAPRELQPGTTRQAGAVYVRTVDGAQSWRLVPSDAATRFQFGRTVDIDGNVLVVGAVLAAYVFRFDGANWVEEAKLEGSCADGRFGTAVAVNGGRLLVGAPLMGCLDASVEGHVFFYERSASGAWELARKLTSHYGTVGSYYGWSVSMEGDTAAVGAPGWGEVFTYRHDGSTWQIGERIVDPIWGSARSFGQSVSFRGGALAVGTPGNGEVREGAGAAYVYRLTTSGGWIAEGKLLPPPTHPAQKLTGSYYGSTVGISGDLLVMGGPQADVEGDQEGAVLVFARQNGSWALQSRLTAPDAGSYDFLGTGLAIDNGVVLAGAPGHGAVGSNVGAAYLFLLEGDTPAPPPVANQSPIASFTYVCSKLNCTFDASGSYDPDGTVSTYAWTFGDGNSGSSSIAQHGYASVGTYSVRLTVTDNNGVSGSTTVAVTVNDAEIVLNATSYKVRGLQKIDLVWSGAASASVDVYFSSSQQSEFFGVLVATLPNLGSYTHHIDRRRGDTYRHWVCEAGTNVCSNKTTVVFN